MATIGIAIDTLSVLLIQRIDETPVMFQARSHRLFAIFIPVGQADDVADSIPFCEHPRLIPVVIPDAQLLDGFG